MPGYSLIALSAQPTAAVLRGIGADQFSAPTPCADFTVRDLIDHLLTWGPALEGAAHKQFIPPAQAVTDVTDDDLKFALAAQFDRLVAAWAEPDAWAGSTRLGGPTELPAALIGGMVMGEFVVHGWDLARATGQQVAWDPDMLAFLQQQVEQTAEQGRELGVYGPRVEIPATATALDKILGLTGRDPGWAQHHTFSGRR